MNNLTPHLNATMQRLTLAQELKKQGFKQYQHKHGFIAWSKTNLCEHSDEWNTYEIDTNIPL